ncbi:MAG: MarR family winged helix-turn-helix transcriptional regulator [Pseudomonadota bacterium]
MKPNRPKFHFLLHAADLVEERLREQLTPLGLRPRQARIMDALSRMGQASQSALAREFDVSPASMSTMTARLIAADFITRMEDPEDPRGNILRLSEKGLSLMGQIDEAWAEVDRIIEELIGPGDFQDLARLTQALRDALGGRMPGPEGPVLDRS